MLYGNYCWIKTCCPVITKKTASLWSIFSSSLLTRRKFFYGRSSVLYISIWQQLLEKTLTNIQFFKKGTWKAWWAHHDIALAVTLKPWMCRLKNWIWKKVKLTSRKLKPKRRAQDFLISDIPRRSLVQFVFFIKLESIYELTKIMNATKIYKPHPGFTSSEII